MPNWAYKVIRDNVHGYIRIPEPFVARLIDTELFQRLRCVEQTGMRVLFPSARHDRFIHSLGTYHLGVRAFEAFQRNVRRYYSNQKSADRNYYFVYADDESNTIFWEKHGVLFSIACLLHDCGHAPFSHSYECLYDVPFEAGTDRRRLHVLLAKEFESESSAFVDDFTPRIGKTHEHMSALLVSKVFAKDIEEIITAEFRSFSRSDIEFVARAIVGCPYNDKSSRWNQICNCLIRMLNSYSIDVDKLDYLIRDARLSGVDSMAIDVERLLGSLTVAEVTRLNDHRFESDMQIDRVVLCGTFEGRLDAHLSGVTRAQGFCGSMAGRVVLYGDARICSDAAFAGGYAKVGGATYSKKVVETVGVEKINTDADFPDGLRLEKGNFRCDHQLNAYVNMTAGELELGPSYVRGKMEGVFSGEVLGYVESAEPADVRVELAFHKSSLSVMQGVIATRNWEYYWIYGHHKVIYYANYLLVDLLCRCARFLAKRTGETAGEIMQKILNMETKTQVCNHSFFRPNDSDILALIKWCYLECSEGDDEDVALRSLCTELFTRKYRKSAWKSLAEFEVLFRDLSRSERMALLDALKDHSVRDEDDDDLRWYGFFDTGWSSEFARAGMNDVVWVSADLTIRTLDPDSTFVLLKDQPYRLRDLAPVDLSPVESSAFYLYYRPSRPDADLDLASLVDFLKKEARKKGREPNPETFAHA